jgi:hypothetical protein
MTNCNDGAGLHTRDADRLKAAIYTALDAALLTPVAPTTAHPGLEWEILDNNDALWTLTVLDHRTNRSSTHYLLAEGDVLTFQAILNIYGADPAFLATALDRPHRTELDYTLTGVAKIGLIKAVR